MNKRLYDVAVGLYKKSIFFQLFGSFCTGVLLSSYWDERIHQQNRFDWVVHSNKVDVIEALLKSRHPEVVDSARKLLSELIVLYEEPNYESYNKDSKKFIR
jgi:hypothetical protein